MAPAPNAKQTRTSAEVQGAARGAPEVRRAFTADDGPSGPTRSTCTAQPGTLGFKQLRGRGQAAEARTGGGPAGPKGASLSSRPSQFPPGLQGPLGGSLLPSLRRLLTRSAKDRESEQRHARAPGWGPPGNFTEQPPPHSGRHCCCSASDSLAVSSSSASRAPSPGDAKS